MQKRKLSMMSITKYIIINPASMYKVSKRYGIKDTFVWDMDADIPDNLVKLTAKATLYCSCIIS